MKSAAAVAALLTLCAVGCGHRSATTTTQAAAALRGLTPAQIPHKPDFALTDTAGHRFRLTAQPRGKLVYLYFGYTHCPDACPLTMATIGAALRRQPAAVRRRIEVVFVTVDPRRDTGPVLRTWLRRYGPSFVGLTGSRSQIRAAEAASGVPLAAPEPQQGVDYSVSHSTLVLAYSPDNQAHVVYSDGFSAGAYAHDMPILLSY
jgi:protein SCO1/2